MSRLLLACLFSLAPLVAHAADKAAGKAPKAPSNALTAAADEIARQVSALRGLQLKAPLKRGVLTRDKIGEKLRERIDKEYTPEEVRAEGRVLKRMGLLPADVDYEKLLLDLLMEQVAGFYDPFVGSLYIADWLPLEMQRPAMAHEIEHALQDQHFGLKKFAEPIKDDGDRQLAHSSLIEGDGTAVMLEFQAQAMGLPIEQLPDLVAQIGKQMLAGSMGQTPLFDKAPQFVRETLIFPYLSGLTFVESLRKGAPWSRVDEVFRKPPDSTEQVLHPEKYLAHEQPMRVTPAPLAALAGKKELRRDVLGELSFQILFAMAPPTAPKGKPAPDGAQAAEKAAAGWGGDRLVAWADAARADAPPVVVDVSAWDTEGDAKEAEVAARRLMAKLAGKPDSDAAVAIDANKDEWSVTRDGDKLALVFGAPAGTQAAIASEALKSWKVTRAQP